MAEIKGLRAEINQLRSEVNEKDRVIAELHDRVSVLEASVDASEQYGRSVYIPFFPFSFSNLRTKNG